MLTAIASLAAIAFLGWLAFADGGGEHTRNHVHDDRCRQHPPRATGSWR